MGNMRFGLILAVLACFQLSEAIKCYTCQHTETGGTGVGDESCKASSKPDDSLLIDCGSLQYTKSGSVAIPVIKGTNDNQPLINLTNNQDMNVYCTKIAIDGKMQQADVSIKQTIRGCAVAIDVEFAAECNTGSLKEVTEKSKDESVKATLKAMGLAYAETSKTLACTCADKDGCNGDTKDVGDGDGGNDGGGGGDNGGNGMSLSNGILLGLIVILKQLC